MVSASHMKEFAAFPFDYLNYFINILKVCSIIWKTTKHVSLWALGIFDNNS